MTLSVVNVPYTSFSCLCISFCVSVCAAVAQKQFQLEPLNSTVLQGRDANFTATVQGTWQVMTWSAGNNLVLTFLYDGNTSVPSSDQYSATLCSNGDKNCVVFTIHNVNRSLPGDIICFVQTGFGNKRAQLNVQGKPADTMWLQLLKHPHCATDTELSIQTTYGVVVEV